MTRLALLVPFAALVLLAGRGRGQDFDLADAFDDPKDVTQKPIPPNKKPTKNDDGGFNLEDAFGTVDDPMKPQPPAPPQPNPGSHGNTGDFSDLDLNDGQPPPDPPKGGGHGGSDSGGKAEENPGMLAGIISSVLVAVVGAVSSFVAYQKKKLCFKASDEENVNMQSQQGAHSEPPVQRTLLQKQ